jgi:hypothetical protein
MPLLAEKAASALKALRQAEAAGKEAASKWACEFDCVAQISTTHHGSCTRSCRSLASCHTAGNDARYSSEHNVASPTSSRDPAARVAASAGRPRPSPGVVAAICRRRILQRSGPWLQPTATAHRKRGVSAAPECRSESGPGGESGGVRLPSNSTRLLHAYISGPKPRSCERHGPATRALQCAASQSNKGGTKGTGS